MTAPRRAPRTLVVSWISGHARSTALADALEADELTMPWARAGQPKWRTLLGYLRSGLETWRGVQALPPGSIAVVMCPPVFAPLIAAAAAGSTRRVVLDAHSGTFNDPSWQWAAPLLRVALRRCRLTVVTNPAVAEGAGVPQGRLVVAHDPLQTLPDHQPADPPYVVFPASDAFDEPLAELAQAARLLQADGVRVVVTGRVRSISAGPGLELAGWLSRADYEQLLHGASAVLALTTREDTMQRTAYEALERAIPVVASSTRALHDALGPAASHCTHQPEAIRVAVLDALERADELSRAAAAVRTRMQQETAQGLAQVRALRADARPDPVSLDPAGSESVDLTATDPATTTRPFSTDLRTPASDPITGRPSR